jgi:3-methylfumaryl-CoA hydratase
MERDSGSTDLPVLRQWIGRTETVVDTITPRLEASLRAIFDRSADIPAADDLATPTIHWCLGPQIVPMSGLGVDGHPARGGFLPPVPLPRRMWAGGELSFIDPLRVGDVVTRQSRIEDVAVKTGRSGSLCFVTVRHVFSTARGLAIDERQDLVYREASRAGAASVPAQPQSQAQWQGSVACNPVLLFRYSALTFNGHRIHYDRDYAVNQEGYADLVVHGPLQAAKLIDLATEIRGTLPQNFSFRGVHPLFGNGAFSVNAIPSDKGLRLWTADAKGGITMRAEASWP